MKNLLGAPASCCVPSGLGHTHPAKVRMGHRHAGTLQIHRIDCTEIHIQDLRIPMTQSHTWTEAGSHTLRGEKL